MSEKQWHESIWLQEDTDGETTWCQDKINDDDCKYIRADKHATLKQALTLIGDIGYDYDGYGTPHDLKKLIDEMVGYARNPQSAVDALTAEEQE